jgi:hypothetical protein
MAEARAAVNTLRVGTLSLEQVTSAAKLRGVQVVESRSQVHLLFATVDDPFYRYFRSTVLTEGF